jgi:uncharacterized protein
MSQREPDRDLRWLRARRADVLSCAAEQDARNVRVFGSVAKGEADGASDVDMLVEMRQAEVCLISSPWSKI